MNDKERDNRYLRARERVDAIKQFYTSLIFYILFIGFLAWLNYYTNQWRYAWFLWAAFGFGIGVVVKAFQAFGWLPYMNKDWEERKIREYMDRDEESRDLPSKNRWQ